MRKLISHPGGVVVMSTELLVHTADPHAAAEEVDAAGGRLLHVLSDHLLVVTLPEDRTVDSLGAVATELPPSLDPAERSIADTWTSRFGVASRSAETLEQAGGRPVISWDDPRFTPPDHLPDREGPVSFEAREGMRSTGTPTSLRLTGSVAVGIVIVSGPEQLAFTSAEKSKIAAEIIEGLNFLATADPTAKVTFFYDWRHPSVAAAAGSGSSYEAFEAPWRNAALKSMGYAASRQGSVDYVNALRTAKGTNWAYVAYFTKYPLHHFAYAGQERLVMHYGNDGWGSDAINQVFAHETCHIFGAADEYGGCGCGGSGMANTPNLNCKNCTSAQVPCLMNANTLQLCSWSRGQIGWQTWERIAGALKHVSAAPDGTVWGVNASDKIYRWHGNGWTQVPGALKQISVGSATHVWGVNSDDKIYRWNGKGWTQISGALKHVSVAHDGTVWGVNASDKIYRRPGDKWQQVAGQLKQIASVGSAASPWGVNSANAIFRRWWFVTT